VGGASADSLPEEQANSRSHSCTEFVEAPPTPDPSPPRARARGGRGGLAVIASVSEAIHGAASAASEEWIASSQKLLAMTARHDFAISPHAFFARGILLFPPSPMRAQGMPGARCAPRSRVQDGVESAHEHTGHTGITRHSPRNGFNGYFVISPVRRAFWPPSPAFPIADLTPASGCQDHTFSPSARKSPRQKRFQRPPHPAPRL
jgi:hypothetical protein